MGTSALIAVGRAYPPPKIGRNVPSRGMKCPNFRERHGNHSATPEVSDRGNGYRRMKMKYLLIALALSLGFCGACLAQTSPKNTCHIEGNQLVCK